ncbi:MAG: VanZ family protein [Acidobacteriota bacterium]
MNDPFRPWRARYSSSGKETVLRLVPCLIYLLLISAVSSVPGSHIPSLVDDRIEHFIEYFGLGVVLLLAAVAFMHETVRPVPVLAVWAFAVCYAFFDEWHQSFVPGRDSSLKDIAFDTLGVSCALIFLYFAATRTRPAE